MGLSRSRFPKVGDLDAPLALLEQHGYIRRDARARADRPGPAAVTDLRSPPRPCHGNHAIHAMSSSVDYVVSVAAKRPPAPGRERSSSHGRRTT